METRKIRLTLDLKQLFTAVALLISLSVGWASYKVRFDEQTEKLRNQQAEIVALKDEIVQLRIAVTRLDTHLEALDKVLAQK